MQHPVVTIADLEGAINTFVAGDASAVSGRRAGEEAVALGRLISQLEGARLERLATVQAEGTWALTGARSAAAWLASEERTTKATAGADLKTARLLVEHLPATRAAVLDGSVPVGHAKALTRRCLRSPAMAAMLTHASRGEGFMLSQAHLPLDDYTRFLTSWSRRVDPEAEDRAYREGRDDFWVQAAVTTDGVAVRAFLDPVSGEGFLTMLKAEIGVPAKSDKRDTPRRLHDALAAITARVLDGGALGRHASVRPQVVVHVPLATLEAKADAAGIPSAWLQESQIPLPRRVLDRILCDSELTRIVLKASSDVLDVGRSQRTFTGARRRALDARDGGCRWPGCHAPPRECEGHHTTPWREGGRTDPREGALLCWHHHDFVHAHDVSIEVGTAGELTFRDPLGQLIGTSYPRPGPDDPLPWEDAA